jgi:hypothetical protein
MTPVESLMVSLSFRKLSYGLAESSPIPIPMPLPEGTYWPYTPALSDRYRQVNRL